MNNSEDDKKYLRFLAACEQAGAGMRSVATVVSSYFLALVEAGLAREEALQLTVQYQNYLFELSKILPLKD